MRCHVIATSRIHNPRGRRHTKWNWERRGIRCITNHTNDISDDVYKIIFGNGENGSRRQRLCQDRSHRLDTRSVSNYSNRNRTSWFVALIASLNIMVKTFTKIAKTFVGLLATIIAIRIKHILILHLEEKCAKNGLQKWNLREKLGKEHLIAKKSTLEKSQL